MQALDVIWVCFHDVGGWLFPDPVRWEDLPNREILEFVWRLVLLFGPDHQYVVSNTRGKGDFRKNSKLLHLRQVPEMTGLVLKKDLSAAVLIQQRTGTILNNDLALGKRFLSCDGPETKGPRLHAIVEELRRAGFNVSAAVFDNNCRVLRNMSDEVHKIGYHLKHLDDPGTQEWFERWDPRTYQADSIPEIAQVVANMHLEFLWELIQENPDPRLERLFWEEEIPRTQAILRPYKPLCGKF